MYKMLNTVHQVSDRKGFCQCIRLFIPLVFRIYAQNIKVKNIGIEKKVTNNIALISLTPSLNFFFLRILRT